MRTRREMEREEKCETERGRSRRSIERLIRGESRAVRAGSERASGERRAWMRSRM
jgi:hypothetical protein